MTENYVQESSGSDEIDQLLADRDRIEADLLADIDGDPPWVDEPEGIEAVSVVARVGDREYVCPPVVTLFMYGRFDKGESPVRGRKRPQLHNGEWEVSIEAEIVGGEPRYRRVELVCHAPLTPLDLQRMPWAMWLEAAVERAAVTSGGGHDPKAVAEARVRERAATERRKQLPRRREEGRRLTAAAGNVHRHQVSVDRLREVVRLHDEAQAIGKRWDTHAANQLGGDYKPTYMRELYRRARALGLA